MIEFQVVEVPTQFPSACSCGNQKGPLIDTHREKMGIHEYVCLRCAQEYARIFGFLPGDKLEELAAAAQAVASFESELNETLVQLAAERDESELKDRVIDELKADRDKWKGRVEQLETNRQRIAKELVA